jgi:hypothetical protein
MEFKIPNKDQQLIKMYKSIANMQSDGEAIKSEDVLSELQSRFYRSS